MDESGQTTDRFMCVGGTIVRQERVAEIRATIEAIKRSGGIGSEVKWSAVRTGRLHTYKALVRYFFKLLEANSLHFHVLACDFHGFDHRASGGKIQSVSKMLYQLALHRGCKPYGASAMLDLFPDDGDHASALLKYHGHLNSASKRLIPWRRCFERSPVRQVAPTNSCNEPLLQLNDIILGAVSYRRNRRDERHDASDHKAELAALVCELSGFDRFGGNTPRAVKRFTTWNFVSAQLPPLAD